MKNVNLTIEKREPIGIVGASGASKSTLNVVFGLEGDGIDRNRVLKCCKMATMEDFLAELPNGIDTPIGERGVKLSGGKGRGSPFQEPFTIILK